MAEYTIKIRCLDGDPQGARIIVNDDWVWSAIAFPKDKWDLVKDQENFKHNGVYILVGYSGHNDDVERIYIGEGDATVRGRIESHIKNKDFWEWGVAILSEKFDKARIQWLEYALCKLAGELGVCVLENGNFPSEPTLDDSSKSSLRNRLKEILHVAELIGLEAFDESAKKIKKSNDRNAEDAEEEIAEIKNDLLQGNKQIDAIVVPSGEETFNKIFMEENCWYAIRISENLKDKIKYLAIYRKSPISAITHYAAVENIVVHETKNNKKTGKMINYYRLNFKDKPKVFEERIKRRRNGDQLQGPRYTNLETLRKAKVISDVWP